MITMKQLDGGGDTALKEMMETASILGHDLIELMWIPKNGLPYFSIVEVVGYQYPIMSSNNNLLEENATASAWIDSTLRFYPDRNGRCWGYVFDTDYNKDLIASSLSCGWFRIVDKKEREDIIELATQKGYKIDVTPQTEVLVKKTKREKEAEDHSKNLEKRLDEYKYKMDALLKELEETKEVKERFEKKKLAGVKVPNREEILESK